MLRFIQGFHFRLCSFVETPCRADGKFGRCRRVCVDAKHPVVVLAFVYLQRPSCANFVRRRSCSATTLRALSYVLRRHTASKCAVGDRWLRTREQIFYVAFGIKVFDPVSGSPMKGLKRNEGYNG